MNPKQTPEQAAGEALIGYADGLDASLDGRGFGENHEAARQSIIKAFQDRAELIAVLEDVLSWGGGEMMRFTLAEARAVIDKVKS